jgi:hypothetical protein
MEAVHVLWLIMPAFDSESESAVNSGFMTVVLGIAAQVGVGGTWLGTFLWQLSRFTLVSSRAPAEEEAVHHG